MRSVLVRRFTYAVCIAFTLAAMLNVACAKKGGECQPCRDSSPTSPEGCDSGMTCRLFSGGGHTCSLCARPSTSECPVEIFFNVCFAR